MFKTVLSIALALVLIGCSETTIKKHHERYYQTKLCNNLDGEMEYTLKDRTRVDCLTNEYAIEVDFAKKWAESIGQSLYYAEMTGRKPAVGLIVGEKDARYLRRLKVIADKFGIRIIKIKRLKR